MIPPRSDRETPRDSDRHRYKQRNLIVRTLALGNNSTVLGISPDGSRAYVTTLVQQAGGPGLTVVDLNAWAILGRVRGVSFPREIAFRTAPRGMASQ